MKSTTFLLVVFFLLIFILVTGVLYIILCTPTNTPEPITKIGKKEVAKPLPRVNSVVTYFKPCQFSNEGFKPTVYKITEGNARLVGDQCVYFTYKGQAFYLPLSKCELRINLK